MVSRTLRPALAALTAATPLAAQTTLESVSSSGALGNQSSEAPSISADGRFIAFQSDASTLVAGDTNNVADIFLRDRALGVTTRLTMGLGGTEANGSSSAPQISADGRFVTFLSWALNLVAGDTNAQPDVFVHEIATGITTRVSVNSAGVQANAISFAPVISADGRYIAFHSAATNLVTGDSNVAEDVFLRDRQLGTTLRVSVASGGSEGDGVSRKARLSSDGRVVLFESIASNLDPGDLNTLWDVFAHDRITGTTEIASVDTNGGGGDYASNVGALSASGRFVVFQSYATNLVSGDTNNSRDVFLRDRGTDAPASYCTAGTTSLGCVPLISGAGTPSLSAASGFTLSVSALDGQRSGLVFYGVSGSVEFPWAPGSSSFLCVKSPTQRLPLQSTGGTVGSCDGSLSVDFLAFLATNPGSLGQPFGSGDMVYAQAWFRDPPSPKSTSLSDALVFTLLP